MRLFVEKFAKDAQDHSLVFAEVFVIDARSVEDEFGQVIASECVVL